VMRLLLPRSLDEASFAGYKTKKLKINEGCHEKIFAGFFYFSNAIF